MWGFTTTRSFKINKHYLVLTIAKYGNYLSILANLGTRRLELAEFVRKSFTEPTRSSFFQIFFNHLIAVSFG